MFFFCNTNELIINDQRSAFHLTTAWPVKDVYIEWNFPFRSAAIAAHKALESVLSAYPETRICFLTPRPKTYADY